MRKSARSAKPVVLKTSAQSQRRLPMTPIGNLKQRILGNSVFRSAWSRFRERQLLSHYENRREKYRALAEEKQLVYQRSQVSELVRKRLSSRGYSVPQRKIGQTHCFAFVPKRYWHEVFFADLKELGRLTVFCYMDKGYEWEEFARADREGIRRRKEMNDMVVPALRAAMKEQPVDWMFIFATGIELSASVIRRIQEEFGIPVVSLCMDDKQSWDGPWMGDHRGGQVDIASALDLACTTARVACEWYLVEGGCPMFLPEAYDPTRFFPTDTAKDIPVSFVGWCYGYRPAVIEYLAKHGIAVATFGNGWPNNRYAADPNVIFNRSQINLGMGGVGYSETGLTNLKGRDFEIPGAGGGVYLTLFNSELAESFTIGKEVLCYANRNEMLELIRYYLAHPGEALEIAATARHRCEREHRWIHRFIEIGKTIGFLSAEGVTKEPKESNGDGNKLSLASAGLTGAQAGSNR